MANLTDSLENLGDALARAVAAAFDDDGLRSCDDDELLAALAEAGRVRRHAEAILGEVVAHMLDRDDHLAHPDRLTTRHGCRSHVELVQRATRVSSRTASDVVATAEAIGRRMAISSGEVLPAEFPRMREALRGGDVGIDGMTAVTGAFRGCMAGRAGLLAADEELAAAARGDGQDAAPPASADELRAIAQVWAAYLDQDGAEPAEARALRKRGVTIGRRGADGLVPLRGNLLPEVAAQLRLGFDSVLNPKVDDVVGPCFTEIERVDRDEPVEHVADPRTYGQKQHDALAALLAAAAASGALPTLGGAPPTLVVSVREEDLATGRGHAHLPGDAEPISLAAARQIACAGAVQRVVSSANGRMVSITTLDRVFNHHQRRGITIRDGGCIIPGCDVPPQWCEIHHVQEHSRGGQTHTDNGASWQYDPKNTQPRRRVTPIVCGCVPIDRNSELPWPSQAIA
ncbi:protein of unknown function [Microbacterium sp. cf046]|uniref:HNH endonuclease signature motif containing protein n=1 Tax=Microbacterium sp. cf046 TaxID=1761803 RepID=UPI0008DEE9FE|nr:HNH endonuclease signature motif containing protein [Microbacterium sp. cf046]SFS13151.1 protein of unknown function [Microbacterium sp. cf046]